MARMTKSDEIFFYVRAAMTPEDLVMHFQLVHAATDLASPTIAPQNGEP